jgi:hypothetical protein
LPPTFRKQQETMSASKYQQKAGLNNSGLSPEEV